MRKKKEKKHPYISSYPRVVNISTNVEDVKSTLDGDGCYIFAPLTWIDHV